MAVESDADRLTFLSADDFGVAATIGAATVYGIFDDEYTGVNAATGEVATSDPRFLCRASDVTSVAQGTTVTINSVAYKVTNIEPDGTGFTSLVLSRD